MFEKAVFVDFHKFVYTDEMYDQIYSNCKSYIHVDSDKDDLIDSVKDADAILAFYGSPITKDIINSATNLKYIGVTSAAYGFVDLEAASLKGVPVTHTASYAAQGVAEFVIAMLLYNVRNFRKEKQRIDNGDYSFEKEKGSELGGKTLGIVGAGAIGSRVGEIAHAFGMDIVYSSRKEKERIKAIGGKRLLLNDVAKSADHLAITTSLNDETEGMLNDEFMSDIKKDAVVACIAHLPLFNIEKLYEHIKNGRFTLATDQIDSLGDEWFEKFRVLEQADLYPHIGAGTKECDMRVEDTFIRNIEAFLDGKYENVVNGIKPM